MRKPKFIKPLFHPAIQLPLNDELKDEKRSKSQVMLDYINNHKVNPATTDFFRAGYKNISFTSTLNESFFTVTFDDGSKLKVGVNE